MKYFILVSKTPSDEQYGTVPGTRKLPVSAETVVAKKVEQNTNIGIGNNFVSQYGPITVVFLTSTVSLQIRIFIFL